MSRTATLLTIPLPGAEEPLQVAQSSRTHARVIRAPRRSASLALPLPELQQPGLLALVGTGRTACRDLLGLNSAPCIARLLAAEIAAAAVWQSAVVISVGYRALSTEDLAYLKAGMRELIQAANGLGVTARNRSREDLERILEELPDLCALVGEGFCSAASVSLRPGQLLDGEEVYYCELPGVFAMGRPEVGGFRVLNGARALRAPEAHDDAIALQKSLLDCRVLAPVRESAQHLQFVQDHLFATQALAATAVLGRSSTGFFDWIRGDGAPIGETLRAHALK